ncbi:MAG: M48 family metalloprotease [Thainema sp.]
MGITVTEFDALVRKLEQLAKKNPGSYKFRVALLAVLGYAYIFIVLAIVWGGIALIWPHLWELVQSVRSIRLKTVLLLFTVGVPVVLSFIVIEALWVHVPPPTGLEVNPKQVPKLYQLVKELRRELKTPDFHQILITDELNAAVAQVPRFGVFGGYRNYLIVGLPLMQTLSPSQFRAVLAHELGHLSRRHGQFGHWIYRIRKTWFQILEGFQNAAHQPAHSVIAIASILGITIFVTFFNWYVPFFAAYSFVLARADEYEADRYAAKLAGAKNLASALVNLQIKGGHVFSNFWDDLAKQADSQVDPPQPYTSLPDFMQRDLNQFEAQSWLKQALDVDTTTDDTHPCLRERLQALGCPPDQAMDWLRSSKASAAIQYLGNALPYIVGHFDQTWQQSIAARWKARYTEQQQLRHQMETLEQRTLNGPLSTNNAWQLAALTAEFKTPQEAIPYLKQVLKDAPNHTGANQLAGEILLEQGNKVGIRYLEKAMMYDLDIFATGAAQIHAFIQTKAGEEAAARYMEKAQKQYELVKQARHERSYVRSSDSFVQAKITPEQLSELQDHLSQYSAIQAAYLAQKVVQHFPDQPFYVLAFQTKQFTIDDSDAEKDRKLIQQVAEDISMPGETYMLLLTEERSALKRKLQQLAGAQILPS